MSTAEIIYERAMKLPDDLQTEALHYLDYLLLLLAWIEIHKDELMADWNLAVSGQQPYKIEPLK